MFQLYSIKCLKCLLLQISFKFSLQVKSAVTTPHIDKVLTQFRQIASGGVTDPVTQLVSQSSQPVPPADRPDPVNEERIRKLEHQVSQLIQKVNY